jgi:nucleoside-diphosphate-sugar epimerase
MRELVRLIERIVGRPASIRYTPRLYPGGLVGATDLMQRVLGVTPTVTLAEGLTAMHRARA